MQTAITHQFPTNNNHDFCEKSKKCLGLKTQGIKQLEKESIHLDIELKKKEATRLRKCGQIQELLNRLKNFENNTSPLYELDGDDFGINFHMTNIQNDIASLKKKLSVIIQKCQTSHKMSASGSKHQVITNLKKESKHFLENEYIYISKCVIDIKKRIKNIQSNQYLINKQIEEQFHKLHKTEMELEQSIKTSEKYKRKIYDIEHIPNKVEIDATRFIKCELDSGMNKITKLIESINDPFRSTSISIQAELQISKQQRRKIDLSIEREKNILEEVKLSQKRIESCKLAFLKYKEKKKKEIKDLEKLLFISQNKLGEIYRMSTMWNKMNQQAQAKLKTLTPFLGMELNAATEWCVRISHVVPNGPTMKAGLRKGDRIKQINNQYTPKIAEYKKIISTVKPGDRLSLQVQRKSNVINAVIHVGSENMSVRDIRTLKRIAEGGQFIQPRRDSKNNQLETAFHHLYVKDAKFPMDIPNNTHTYNMTNTNNENLKPKNFGQTNLDRENKKNC